MHAVIEVHRDREGLRRDDAPEARLPRECLVPVDRVGIVHRLYPAPHIGCGAWDAVLTAADELPHPWIDVAQIESHRALRRGLRHLTFPLLDAASMNPDAP